MSHKTVIRIVIFLIVLIAGGWAGFRYGVPALMKLQADAQQQAAEYAPISYQTARVRTGGGDTTITTSGVVRSKQSTVLFWQTSGTIKQVNVTTGQIIDARMVLAELEPTSLPQAVILAQAERVNAQKALDTLLQSNQARANAQMALVKAQKALDDAQENRLNKLYQRASDETIDIARAHLIEANEALDKAEDFFNSHSSDTTSIVYASALSQLAKARQNQIRAQYNLDYVVGLPEPLDIQEADAQIAVAEANLLQAKLDWDRVKDGPNEEDVAAAEARVTAAQATLNLARITAPFNGTLTLVNSKVGDQVTVGTTAFQLDDLSHLYLDVAVVEDEIVQVQVGQPVTIHLDALPNVEYNGMVTEIANFGKATGGTVNFTVTVEILSPDASIKPGMTASVVVTTRQEESSLLVPTRAVSSLNGQTVVYLLKDGFPAPVAVVTGSAEGPDTQITVGAIEAGDLVVLNPDAK